MASRPPFNALYVFCEAARSRSFKMAAESLCVTPGAVSRQIQSLESHLRRTLFERNPGGLQLTAHGRRLLDQVAPHMAAIDAEVERVRMGARKAVIRIDVSVTFATHWLIPRLGEFALAQPDIQVEVVTVDGPIDLTRPADLFIRRDVEELRGLPSRRFMDEYSLLVCSPRLLKGRSTLGKDALGRSPRIGARSRPDLWRQWCGAHGLQEAAHRPTHEFGNTVLAIQAAVAGLGLMVAPEAFVRTMLADGTLKALAYAPVETGSYSLATQAGRRSRALLAVMEWVIAAAAEASSSAP